MHSSQLTDCCDARSGPLEHVNFFNRQLLTADDLVTERDYYIEKLRRHNRYMHGWGVACGMNVVAAPIPDVPWRVRIEAGYALGPFGDEILVGEAVYFDLAACLKGSGADPCEPCMSKPQGAGTSSTVYLAIEYAECLARPVQVAYSGCGCDDDPCQYSRIRDGFQIQCLPQLPPQPPLNVDLCQVVRGGAIAPCPPCPTSPWVVLAKINLPSSDSANIMASSIDTISVRRVILSAAVLQQQIVACCCGPSSSSSASSSSSTLRQARDRILAGHAVLNVAQRTTGLGGKTGGVQFAVTVINSGAAAAEAVSLEVNLAPELDPTAYRLKADGWQASSLTKLASAPIRLAPGKAQTFSFQVRPVRKSDGVRVTATATATESASGVSHSAAPIEATIGG